MINFVNFLLRKVYSSIEIDKEIVYIAFEKTVIDVKYHYPDLDEDIIKNRIETNNNELAIYLFI
jgi:serine O-acetyltransferase